jgi:hypothetical protein
MRRKTSSQPFIAQNATKVAIQVRWQSVDKSSEGIGRRGDGITGHCYACADGSPFLNVVRERCGEPISKLHWADVLDRIPGLAKSADWAACTVWCRRGWRRTVESLAGLLGWSTAALGRTYPEIGN